MLLLTSPARISTLLSLQSLPRKGSHQYPPLRQRVSPVERSNASGTNFQLAGGGDVMECDEGVVQMGGADLLGSDIVGRQLGEQHDP